MTPAQFNKRMKKIGALVTENVGAGHRATALVVDQAVVLATPVDTGRARANWRASSGSSDFKTYESVDFNSALTQARAVIEGDRTGVIYITNNLDYIGSLNDGSSAQAPAGFVEQAVQIGLVAAAKIRALKGA